MVAVLEMIKIIVYLKSGDRINCEVSEEDLKDLQEQECSKPLLTYGNLTIRECDISAILEL